MAHYDDELLRGALHAIERRDATWLVEHCTPDVVIVQPPEVPDSKSYEGAEGAAEAMVDWPPLWEDLTIELLEVVGSDEQVAVGATRHRARGLGSGIEMDFEVFYVYRTVGGKFSRVEMYFGREQALAAASGWEGSFPR